MKLVIDIPQEVIENPHNYCCYALANTISNGTPLDDIRQEIEEERKSVRLSAFVGNQLTGEYSNLLYDGEHRGLLKALEIIDKHIGERSEDAKDSD